ncbi:hypothetical protein H5410_022233 [Solanum commersonii]|uniref:Uncharacterized protein n=1 Tax=Solanum commersonii TaxID=4109 RepID=A0A9J5ZGK6_SOLCO|nr:hypothetical protein H5410_022233 [Solanum commersonii]
MVVTASAKVLSKIVSVAFKYHFRMPPYFTLLLRSLASLEGQGGSSFGGGQDAGSEIEMVQACVEERHVCLSVEVLEFSNATLEEYIEEDIEVRIDTQVIPRRGSFKYFGLIIQKNGEIDDDVTHSIGAGCMKLRLAYGVLYDKSVSLRLEGKFYLVVVRPTLLYWSDCTNSSISMSNPCWILPKYTTFGESNMHLLMVLNSLSNIGLAVAGDPSFKTFEAAIPYVVRKLLSDNSVASRKILHSVVLNRKKEFQWQKLALFLKAAANRKGLNTITAPNPQASLAYLNTIMAPNPQASLAYSSDGASGVFDVANLVLRILPSKDGIVLRRLLMTADGASLVRAFISKEAKFFRQHLCRIVADILSQWIFEALGSNVISSQMQLTGAPNVMLGSSSAVFSRDYDCNSTLRDRRLKLILFKVLGSARKSPILMMRFLCSSCLIFIKASAVACHRFLVCLSMSYLDRASLAPREVVVGA